MAPTGASKREPPTSDLTESTAVVTNVSFNNVLFVVLPLSHLIHFLRLCIRTGTRNSFCNINVKEVFH